MLPHIPSAALRLALLGFLCNLKPSEPYLSLYLTDGKRLSTDALASEVYPWSTFGGFVFLLPFALLSEVVGCRPVILLGLLCREATRVLLIYGEGVRTMAAMQLCYAASHASMSFYFAYVYCVATPEQYALYHGLWHYFLATAVGLLYARSFTTLHSVQTGVAPSTRGDALSEWTLLACAAGAALLKYRGTPVPRARFAIAALASTATVARSVARRRR